MLSSKCIVFIHFCSASLSMSHSEALPTTTSILRRSLDAEALWATASEGLAHGPYVAVRVGFEPPTPPLSPMLYYAIFIPDCYRHGIVVGQVQHALLQPLFLSSSNDGYEH